MSWAQGRCPGRRSAQCLLARRCRAKASACCEWQGGGTRAQLPRQLQRCDALRACRGRATCASACVAVTGCWPRADTCSCLLLLRAARCPAAASRPRARSHAPELNLLVAFGGYNGKYHNSVSVYKLPSELPAQSQQQEAVDAQLQQQQTQQQSQAVQPVQAQQQQGGGSPQRQQQASQAAEQAGADANGSLGSITANGVSCCTHGVRAALPAVTRHTQACLAWPRCALTRALALAPPGQQQQPAKGAGAVSRGAAPRPGGRAAGAGARGRRR